MFRWGLVAAGAAILYTSFTLWNELDPRLEDARPIDLNEAVQSIEYPGVRFIKLPAIIDRTHRIYESGLVSPAYAPFPSHEVQPLAPTGEIDPDKVFGLLGCQVEVGGPLDPTAIIIESLITNQENQADQILGQRVLAPLAGSDGLIYVLSPLLTTEGKADLQWFDRPRFKGQLCRLEDLTRNLRIPADIDAIHKKFGTMGVYISDDALVIMTERQPKADIKETTSTRHFIPVAGSDQSVFVVATAEQEREIDDSIIGILEPANSDTYREFETILDADLPNKVGMLRVVSNDPKQEQARLVVTAGFGTAGTFLGLGSLLIYRAHRRKVLDLQRCQQIIESSQEAKAEPIVVKTEAVGSDQFPI